MVPSVTPDLVDNSTQLEVFINQIFQGVRPAHEGIAVLAELDDHRRAVFWRHMHTAVWQSHPESEHVERAIESSRLKPTFTSCVLARKYLTDDASSNQRSTGLQRIIDLPRDEETKTFVLFVHLFREADSDRRRDTCDPEGCSHWWHRDLGDEDTVKSILAPGGRH